MNIFERFEKFTSYEPNTGCWLWTGWTDKDGYGFISIDGESKRAHRVSYEIFNRKCLGKNWVLHKCDTPSCVNPHHLDSGDHIQNQKEKVERGRSLRGVRNNKHKITEDDVLKIRAAYSTGRYLQKELGRMFGIKQAAISKILIGIHWRHV